MPRIAGGRDIITQPLYDTLQYPTAGTSAPLRFFTTPLGAGTTLFGTGGKNLSDTNMRQAGQLPSPQTFEIFTIQVSLLSTAAASLATGGTTYQDLQVLLQGAHFILTIGSKQWLELPVYYLPSGGGLEAYATGGAGPAAMGATVHSGVADPSAVFKLSRSITIDTNENFDGQVIVPAASAVTTAVNVRLSFNGELTRSIQ